MSDALLIKLCETEARLEDRGTEITRLRAENDDLAQENARLREALRPFADGWQRFRLSADGPISDWYPHEVVDGVVWGDFLKAARALSQPQEGGP